MLKAGDLRHRITVQKNTPTRGTSGGNVDSWTTHVTARAMIEPTTGREYVGAQQLTSSTTHKFTLRYQEGITPKMRIAFGSRVFDIQYVINHEERNRWLFIMAIEHDQGS